MSPQFCVPDSNLGTSPTTYKVIPKVSCPKGSIRHHLLQHRIEWNLTGDDEFSGKNIRIGFALDSRDPKVAEDFSNTETIMQNKIKTPRNCHMYFIPFNK